MNYTRHIVADMDESMIQCCIICGKVINDYRNVMVSPPTTKLQGYAAGEIYQSGYNPEHTTTIPPKNVTINHCK